MKKSGLTFFIVGGIVTVAIQVIIWSLVKNVAVRVVAISVLSFQTVLFYGGAVYTLFAESVVEKMEKSVIALLSSNKKIQEKISNIESISIDHKEDVVNDSKEEFVFKKHSVEVEYPKLFVINKELNKKEINDDIA